MTSASSPLANRAITESRPDATGPFEVQFARTDFDPLNSRERRVAPGPLGDPGVDDPVLPRVDLEPLAPFVGHLAGRLLQDEAACGIDDVNSSAEGAAVSVA